MQADFAKAVEQHGLKRGVQGSKAEHKTIQKYYAELNTNLLEDWVNLKIINPAEVKPAKKSFFFVETDIEIAQRLNDKVEATIKPIIKEAQNASRLISEAKAIRSSIATQQSRLEELMEALAPLNDNEQQVLISKVRQMSVQMIEDRRQALIERLNKEAQEKLQKREFVKSKKL